MSGRVRSSQVGSGLVRVRVVEFGLYAAIIIISLHYNHLPQRVLQASCSASDKFVFDNVLLGLKLLITVSFII